MLNYLFQDSQKLVMDQNSKVCTICNIHFPDPVYLLVHQRSNHIETHICIICSEAFSQRHLLTHHLQLHQADLISSKFPLNWFMRRDEIHQCSMCPEIFRSAKELREHESTHLRIRLFRCTKCAEVFREESALKQHEFTHMIKCRHCDLVCPNNANFELHLLTHWNCEICKKQFENSEDFEKHNLEQHKHVCELCYAVFDKICELRNHFEKHSDMRLHNCTICFLNFDTKNELKKHSAKEHPGTSPEPAQKNSQDENAGNNSGDLVKNCEVCQVQLPSDRKIAKCKDCRVKRRLRHQTVRTCDVCDLEIGRRNTTGKCESCFEIFKISKSTADEHERNQMKPYQCNVCGVKFLLATSLTKHKHQHKQALIYRCNACGDVFSKSRYLKDHSVKIHNISLGLKK